MSAAKRKVDFGYKDANRDWWRLKLVRLRALIDPATQSVDHLWKYSLMKECEGSRAWRPVWSGTILALYDQVPTVTAVMKDFAAKAAILAVGFAADQRD